MTQKDNDHSENLLFLVSKHEKLWNHATKVTKTKRNRLIIPQFQTAKQLLVKELLRSENKMLKICDHYNSVQTTIKLEDSGNLKFFQKRMDL